MNTLVKLIWFFVIIFVFYLVSVFQFPETATRIEELLGLIGLGDTIIAIRDIFYNIVTHFPTQEEVDLAKDQFIDGLDKTKEQVDQIRSTLSGAKDTYDATKELWDSSSGKIQEVIDIIEDIDGLTSSGTTSSESVK